MFFFFAEILCEYFRVVSSSRRRKYLGIKNDRLIVGKSRYRVDFIRTLAGKENAFSTIIKFRTNSNNYFSSYSDNSNSNNSNSKYYMDRHTSNNYHKKRIVEPDKTDRSEIKILSISSGKSHKKPKLEISSFKLTKKEDAFRISINSKGYFIIMHNTKDICLNRNLTFGDCGSAMEVILESKNENNESNNNSHKSDRSDSCVFEDVNISTNQNVLDIFKSKQTRYKIAHKDNLFTKIFIDGTYKRTPKMFMPYSTRNRKIDSVKKEKVQEYLVSII
ncbi:hypothetical protein EHP00_1175 [Ecytonucleospora hepatopenaei]|uniref:Uncharacterized protein n=1 Tax=Ecytonucleospora hepatopenaei TaxID=646526 RepID=A0A1W0E4C3_9MICR|nr:hypothetical protein EHP00_1175 [Ecytonucleospora hepatopenaei]